MADADTGPMDDADTGAEPLPVIPVEGPGPLTAEAVLPRRKGRPILAWIVIWLCIGFVLWEHHQPQPVKQEEQIGEGIGELTLKSQARVLVGTASLLNHQAEIYENAKVLNTGPINQRLRFIVLAGELAGPEEALNQLRDLERRFKGAGITPSETQVKLIDTLRHIYLDYQNKKFAAPSVPATDRALLIKQLNWFGELALAPAADSDAAARAAVLRPALRTAIVYYCSFAAVGLVGLIGFVGLVFFLVFLFLGKLGRGVVYGSLHGGVYAETFALWMLVFFAISFAGQLAAEKKWLRPGPAGFFLGVLLECLTLLVLLWPVVRGIPWRQVRWETGLHAGRRPWLEPLVGLSGNAMSIPLLALGIVATFFLMRIQSRLQGTVAGPDNFTPPDAPGHPIVKQLAGAGWLQYLQILVLASVVAPIVEETLFRGVLYRHCRDATVRLGYGWSVLVSALLTSFVFAVVHPQGLIAIPLLMALAFMFCLLREWRGTLIPGMVAHGVSNALVLLFSISILGN